MANELEQALEGFDEVTGTESGTWYAVQAKGGDATYSATCANGDVESSFTLPNGVITYGTYTQLAVTSGTLKAYRYTGDNFPNPN